MPRPDAMRLRFGPELGGLAVLVLLLAIVELLVRSALLNPFLVPQPSAVLLAFGRIVAEENVLHRFLVTGSEAGTAAVLVACIGVPLGALLHRAHLLRAAIGSWIAAVAAAPIVLAYPLFLVMFGRSASTIIVISVLSGLPPVILMTTDSLQSVRPALIDVGKSLRMNAWSLFWKIMFPAALPGIFSGLRIGFIFALINVVGVEFLINFGGLGPLINELAERYDLPGTYAAIGFVVLVSIVVFLILEALEKWLRPGKR
ncbi:ABC transporter permease [Castellaniella defragrans]|uniref:ABC transporter permease n=1 Tax=Castellaniella defragrans TaxID=75697 RepID=UPI002AFE143B|nr:ABC transporter permease subunit [Castellaniella defragrans]